MAQQHIYPFVSLKKIMNIYTVNKEENFADYHSIYSFINQCTVYLEASKYLFTGTKIDMINGSTVK